MRVYRWEMGITREEFVRLLPAAVGGEPFEDRGGAMHGEGWRVRFESRPHRRLALIAMPVLEVVLELDADEGAFVERFLLGFQRAGG